MSHAVVRLLVLVATVAAAAPCAEAQEPAPDPAPTDLDGPAGSSIESDSREVQVAGDVQDGAIERRLERILGATGQFEELDVLVDSGVVFLRGFAPDHERRSWAAALARRTEGVVAVVEELDVLEPPLWTLDPARSALAELWVGLVRRLPLLVAGLVVLLLTLPLSRGARRLATYGIERRADAEMLKAFGGRVVGLLVGLAGVYIAVRVSGLTQIATTIIGGTGLVGLALGFAFRDIAENFLAGVLLSLRRPFRIGDTIEVAGHTGVVRGVASHGTQLMDFDGNIVRLSNTEIYKSGLRNLTSNPKTRESFDVGIGYDASVEDAQAILIAVAVEHEAVLGEPEPFVLVQELGAATVNLRTYFWVDARRFSRPRVRSAVIRRALAALLEAGISMPDDAREVVFPHPVPLRIERAGRDEEAPRARGAEARKPSAPDARQARGEKDGGEGSLASEVDELERQAEAVEEDGTLGWGSSGRT